MNVRRRIEESPALDDARGERLSSEATPRHHEHFLAPVRILDGHYAAPSTAGFSAQMHASSISEYTYPDGTFWSADLASAAVTA